MYCVINKPNNYYTNVINQVNCKKIKKKGQNCSYYAIHPKPKIFFYYNMLDKNLFT
jgi:hypothetical protein